MGTPGGGRENQERVIEVHWCVVGFLEYVPQRGMFLDKE
jgi:hypothetical protein